jgi:hypothetical protein
MSDDNEVVLIKDGEQIILVGNSFKGLAKEATLQEVRDKLDNLAKEETLQSVLSKLDELAKEDKLDNLINFLIFDTYSNEFTLSGTGSVDLIVPDSGKSITVKGCYVITTSSSGVIRIKGSSGKVIDVLYASSSKVSGFKRFKIVLDVDEKVVMEYDGLDSGSGVFVVINYDVR